MNFRFSTLKARPRSLRELRYGDFRLRERAGIASEFNVGRWTLDVGRFLRSQSIFT